VHIIHADGLHTLAPQLPQGFVIFFFFFFLTYNFFCPLSLFLFLFFLSLLTHLPDLISSISGDDGFWDLVMSLLTDERVEVRQLASDTLAGLICMQLSIGKLRELVTLRGGSAPHHRHPAATRLGVGDAAQRTDSAACDAYGDGFGLSAPRDLTLLTEYEIRAERARLRALPPPKVVQECLALFVPMAETPIASRKRQASKPHPLAAGAGSGCAPLTGPSPPLPPPPTEPPSVRQQQRVSQSSALPPHRPPRPPRPS
jgi:hypothetical protein